MDTYLEKVTFAVTASSSKAWATATSTKAFSGYIHALYLSPDGTNPLKSASSSYFQLRAGTTIARTLSRSSSGVNGTRYWYPTHTRHYSTDGTAFGLDGMRVPVVREKITLVKIAGATSAGGGSSEGMGLTVFLEGVHP